MSKATEWAHDPTFGRTDLGFAVPDMEAYPCLFPGEVVTCTMRLRHNGPHINLSPQEALALATWINDIFGEATA